MLIRSLMLRKLKGDSSAKDVKGVAVSEGSRKRGTERASEGRTSAKRAKSEISSRQKGSNSQASSKDLQSLKVEKLRAILKSKGLSVNVKKASIKTIDQHLA
ncbi:hypothetical protein CJ030_MR4G020961 [Morella rubra]|uniref:Uncharacterized protein n=1 Tax=Morella rubra TaxID=262757 RepID=A0A6A1W3H8_9ROSI|nr:hypothetical protein CJ030_MR4G020961 [Morella rubra]